MSKIRVGLSSMTIEPSLTNGRHDGIGVYTGALLRNLPDFGCEVQPWTFGNRRRPQIAQRYVISKALKDSFLVSTALDLVTPPFVRSKVDADLFHVTDYQIVRMSCPVVATLHDAIPIKHPEWCNQKARVLKNFLQKKAAKKADHVIALSNYSVTELVECFGVNPNRISVIHCGVDDMWRQKPEQAAVDATLAKYGLSPGYFLFVGTLQPRKNVERILQAYLQLPAQVQRERELVIVGRAGWLCDDLLAQIKAAQQNGARVKWLSDVASSDDLRKLYAGAGVFVFPSLYEGFGIPVAEAFAAGVAVVTSTATSLPEVSQGAALEIDPLNVGALADAMRQLATDDALRARCIAAGTARLPELSWQKTAEQTAAVYRAVLAR